MKTILIALLATTVMAGHAAARPHDAPARAPGADAALAAHAAARETLAADLARLGTAPWSEDQRALVTADLLALADAWRGLEGERVEVEALVELFESELMLIATSVIGQIVTDDGETPLSLAVDGWRGSASEVVIHAGADGPDSQCATLYALCLIYCSNLDNFLKRTTCGIDCGIDLARCLGRPASPGPGDPLIGRYINP